MHRQGDDEQAHRDQWLSTLVSDHGADLLRFLRSRLTHGDQAQDLAQEVYLRLLRIDDVRVIRNPRAFALRLAANVAYEWRALARNRMPHSADTLEELVADRDDPAHLLEVKSDLAQIERSLAGLSPRCRAVLLMHRRDGMTYQEIASELGLSVGMIKKYLAKGLAACHQQLGSESFRG